MPKIKLRTLRKYKYQLMEKYLIKTELLGNLCICGFITLDNDGYLTIERGYAWDGASGPTIDTKSCLRGSLVHDALYQLMREGALDIKHRKYADELLRQICLEDGMCRFRAWYWYRVVRLFNGKYAKQGAKVKDAIIEAP